MKVLIAPHFPRPTLTRGAVIYIYITYSNNEVNNYRLYESQSVLTLMLEHVVLIQRP